MTVEDGKSVSIEYTLRLEDEGVVDTNVGDQPMVYTHGAGEIVPGLEEALGGLAVGETRQVTVPPEKAYGPVDPSAFDEVDTELVPEEARSPGAELMARDPSGRTLHVRVHEVRPNTIVIDLNHPLAGKTLTFDVKILDIK